MLIERYQFPQHSWCQLLSQDDVRRPISFEHPMRYERIRSPLILDFLRRLAEGQRLRLRKHVGNQHVMVPPEWIQRAMECNKVARDQPRALVNQLIERVLSICSGLAPI